MTTLIERLRGSPRDTSIGKLDHEAADAIERLRQQLTAHEAVIQQMREALEELHYCSSSHVADDAYYKAIAKINEVLGE